MQPYNQLFDKAPYSDYVLPSNCSKLIGFGVTSYNTHHWQCTDATVTLISSFFDMDNYYRGSRDIIIKATGATLVPAFTTATIISLLPPGWMTERTATGTYKLRMEEIWKMPEFEASRLPDVLAMALLHGIEARMILVSEVNKIIEGNIAALKT